MATVLLVIALLVLVALAVIQRWAAAVAEPGTRTPRPAAARRLAMRLIVILYLSSCW